MFVGILALRLVRIDDGVGVGIATLGVGNVVIRDYEVEPILFRPCDRLKTPDAAVDADDDGTSIGLRLLECRDVNAVPFGKAIRNVERRLAPEDLNHLPKQDRSCRTVDIVIAPDKDLLAGIDRAENPLDRLSHAFQKVRLVK